MKMKRFPFAYRGIILHNLSLYTAILLSGSCRDSFRKGHIMYGNKVEICGINTSKLKTLSDSEKKELLLKARDGDAEARQRLIDGNLRLVLSVIRRFGGRSEDPDDLFQIGCIGLIKAVDNFNTDLDVRFSTYAVPISVPR